MPTESSIHDMMVSVLEALIYVINVHNDAPISKILYNATHIAAHNISKTTETVVDVGRRKVLYKSSKIISAITTARKIIMTH